MRTRLALKVSVAGSSHHALVDRPWGGQIYTPPAPPKKIPIPTGQSWMRRLDSDSPFRIHSPYQDYQLRVLMRPNSRNMTMSPIVCCVLE